MIKPGDVTLNIISLEVTRYCEGNFIFNYLCKYRWTRWIYSFDYKNKIILIINRKKDKQSIHRITQTFLKVNYNMHGEIFPI